MTTTARRASPAGTCCCTMLVSRQIRCQTTGIRRLAARRHRNTTLSKRSRAVSEFSTGELHGQTLLGVCGSQCVMSSMLNQTLVRGINTKYVYSDLSMITLAFVVGTLVKRHSLVAPSSLNAWCAGSAEGMLPLLRLWYLQAAHGACRLVEVVPLRGLHSHAGCRATEHPAHRILARPKPLGQHRADLERHRVSPPRRARAGLGRQLVRIGWHCRSRRVVQVHAARVCCAVPGDRSPVCALAAPLVCWRRS